MRRSSRVARKVNAVANNDCSNLQEYGIATSMSSPVLPTRTTSRASHDSTTPVVPLTSQPESLPLPLSSQVTTSTTITIFDSTADTANITDTRSLASAPASAPREQPMASSSTSTTASQGATRPRRGSAAGTKSTTTRARRGSTRIPRPPNAFILYRSDVIRKDSALQKLEGNHSNLSKIVGRTWQTLSTEEKQKWEEKAIEAQAEHRLKYPDWRFRPNPYEVNVQPDQPDDDPRSTTAGVSGSFHPQPSARDDGDSTPSSPKDDVTTVSKGKGQRKLKSKGKDKLKDGASDGKAKAKGKGKAIEAREKERLDSRCEMIANLMVAGKSGVDLQNAVEEWESTTRAFPTSGVAAIEPVGSSSASPTRSSQQSPTPPLPTPNAQVVLLHPSVTRSHPLPPQSIRQDPPQLDEHHPITPYGPRLQQNTPSHAANSIPKPGSKGISDVPLTQMFVRIHGETPSPSIAELCPPAAQTPSGNLQELRSGRLRGSSSASVLSIPASGSPPISPADSPGQSSSTTMGTGTIVGEGMDTIRGSSELTRWAGRRDSVSSWGSNFQHPSPPLVHPQHPEHQRRPSLEHHHPLPQYHQGQFSQRTHHDNSAVASSTGWWPGLPAHSVSMRVGDKRPREDDEDDGASHRSQDHNRRKRESLPMQGYDDHDSGGREWDTRFQKAYGGGINQLPALGPDGSEGVNWNDAAASAGISSSAFASGPGNQSPPTVPPAANLSVPCQTTGRRCGKTTLIVDPCDEPCQDAATFLAEQGIGADGGGGGGSSIPMQASPIPLPLPAMPFDVPPPHLPPTYNRMSSLGHPSMTASSMRLPSMQTTPSALRSPGHYHGFGYNTAPTPSTGVNAVYGGYPSPQQALPVQMGDHQSGRQEMYSPAHNYAPYRSQPQGDIAAPNHVGQNGGGPRSDPQHHQQQQLHGRQNPSPPASVFAASGYSTLSGWAGHGVGVVQPSYGFPDYPPSPSRTSPGTIDQDGVGAKTTLVHPPLREKPSTSTSNNSSGLSLPSPILGPWDPPPAVAAPFGQCGMGGNPFMAARHAGGGAGEAQWPPLHEDHDMALAGLNMGDGWD